MENNVHLRTARLIQISDLHCYADDNSMLKWSKIPLYPNRSLIRLINHLENDVDAFDALVISGDLVEEETAASYRRIGGILQGFSKPIYVLPGNHDIPLLMQEHLVQLDNNIHFQPGQLFGKWQCLFLNTNAANCPDGHLDAEQFTAMEMQLNKLAVDEHAMLFMHHHPLSIGSPWMDTMGLQQTEPFWEIVSKFPQLACIAFGHIHCEFAVQHSLGNSRTIDVLGTPATCVQVKHIDENLHLDHARPGWRELHLLANGQVETSVHYLPDE